jgi:hypothetical protein
LIRQAKKREEEREAEKQAEKENNVALWLQDWDKKAEGISMNYYTAFML